MTRSAERGTVLTRARALTVLIVAVAVTSLVPLIGRHLLDLEVYRLGGRAVLKGRPLYAQRIGPYGFTYPPIAALLAVPLAVLPFPAASAALAIASLAALAVVLRRSAAELVARMRVAPTAWGMCALVALACCAPVRGTFWNGQVNLVLAALVLADVQGRRFGGAAVGFAAAIKLTPGVFVLYLLAVGRRREARNATLTFGALTCLAWVAMPRDSTSFWTHQLLGGSGIGDEAALSNQSLHGLVLRLGASGAVSCALWLALAAPALLIGLRIAARLAREGRETFAIGVAGVTGCVVSPVSWVHHWVWAVPWLVGMAGAARRRATVAWVCLVGSVVVGWDLLPPDALPSWPPLTFLARNDLVLCAVVTGLACVVRPAVTRLIDHRRRETRSRVTPRTSASLGCSAV